MGKKKKTGGGMPLGRALIKDRFGQKTRTASNDTMLHTTEVQDGYEWGRLNLQSVTEESSFQEFLSTAELAGTEFQAEKLNIKFVNPKVNVGLLTKEEKKSAEEAHEKFKQNLKIPRRPPWSTEMSPLELDKNEKEHFLEWRRSLAVLQEEHGILLTPYEKNLEFWRQLWRVIERSDIIVQIVDARNPLLFRCEDLELYVKEVSKEKDNLILVNKADFLTEKQRQFWADYFSSIGKKVIFFSAILDPNTSTVIEETSEETQSSADHNRNSSLLNDIKNDVKKLEDAVEKNATVISDIINKIEDILGHNSVGKRVCGITTNTSNIVSREELIDLFKTLHTDRKVTEGITTVGLVGYPNVGKSSTINALTQCKKVSVSATPGKTKHFQTLYLDKELMLCDCPGLVMPSFVFTKAEMILNGILPIDQMRDHVPPVNLVCNLIPRHVLEDKYGIMIPKPLEGEDSERPPFSEELLNAYAYNRGFMTANGQPDNSRAARFILKDYINGKLLYCHAPPNVNQTDFHTWPERQRNVSERRVLPPRELRAIKQSKLTTEDLDKVFFQNNAQQVHTKGAVRSTGNAIIDSKSQDQSMGSTVEKPWKKINKHENKKKREKLRRVYAHLDQH